MKNRLSRFRPIVLIAVWFLAAHADAFGQAANRALVRKVNVEATDGKLSEIVGQLSKDARVRIVVQPETLAESADKVPLNMNLQQLPLRTALNLLVYQIHADTDADSVVWSVTRKGIHIRPGDANGEMTVVNHDLRGLAPLLSDPEYFTTAVMYTTGEFWASLDGDGGRILGITPAALRVQQDAESQQEIAELLEQLKAVGAGRPWRSAAEGGSVTAKIRRNLSRPAKLSADKMPLGDLLREATSACDASWWIDYPEFFIEAIDLKEEVEIPQGKESWQEVLTSVLETKKMGFMLEYDCVRFTTLEYIGLQESTRVYDVRTLLTGGATSYDVAERLEEQDALGPWMNQDGEGGTAIGLGPLVVVRHLRTKQPEIARALK